MRLAKFLAACGICFVSSAAFAQSATVAYTFNGAVGYLPNSPLLRAYLKFFGTAFLGGASNNGTVYALTPAASGKLSPEIIYAFQGGLDGWAPVGGLITGPRGVLYGITSEGGTSDWGTVYQLSPPTPPATAWTKTILANLPGPGQTSLPVGPLAIDRAGNLYGASSGFQHLGSVWEVSPPSAGQTGWTFKILYAFTGVADGGGPASGPLLGAGGALFGTSEAGGAGPQGYGTVWQLTPSANPDASWKETTLVTFTGSNGAFPVAGLTAGPDGELYGATSSGGFADDGEIFKLIRPTKQNPKWGFSVLWNFAGDDGVAPSANLLIDKAGTIFGTTPNLSALPPLGNGTVFRLKPPAPGSAQWQKATLYALPSGNAGGLPDQLIGAPDGKLYGTTSFGGTNNCSPNTPTGCGEVFSITNSGYPK